MTKILESLSAFEGKRINQLEMKNVVGGRAATGDTGAGTTCVPTSSSASGCCSYSSDYVHANGGLNFSPTNGTMANSDVNTPC